MPVRQATPEDFPSIIKMCSEFWGHTQFDEPFDPEHTLKMVQMAYDHELLLVAEEDKEIIGFMAAIKSHLLGSSYAWMATELAWWINPENRGKMHSIALIELLESLCISQEVKYLNMAYMETSMPEKVKSLYESLGFKLQETVYTKVLNGGNNSGSSRGGGVSGKRA